MAKTSLAIKPELPKNYTKRGLAIIGPYGNVWTDELFEDDKQAAAYLDNFWNKSGGWIPGEWKLVTATQVITTDEGVSEVSFADYIPPPPGA